MSRRLRIIRGRRSFLRLGYWTEIEEELEEIEENEYPSESVVPLILQQDQRDNLLNRYRTLRNLQLRSTDKMDVQSMSIKADCKSVLSVVQDVLG